MGFHTALRHAADRQRPLHRRVRSLANAIEKFYGLSFTCAFEQLHQATGSSSHRWTSEQVDAAVALIGDARASWSAFFTRAGEHARQAKRRKGYSVRPHHELFWSWIESYFDGAVRAQWSMSTDSPLELLCAHKRHGYLRERAD